MKVWVAALTLHVLIAGSAGAINRSPLPESAERQIYAGGTHVLAVGFSAYRERSWPALNGRRDAERIQSLFLERGVPASNITLALPVPGSKPSLEEIIVRFGEQLTAAGSADSRVVIYIAGHGYTADGIGYLVPPDAPDPNLSPSEFKLAAIPISTLLARVSALRASHVLLILDACFSGLALESLPRQRFPHPAPASDEQSRVLQVITAGSAGQTVADDGLFSELIVSGLVGSADLNLDGWISGTELGMYLRLRMTEATGGRQTPAFGNIVFGKELHEGENWFVSAQLPLQSIAHPTVIRDFASFRDCDECPLLRVVPAPRDASGHADSYLALGVREVSFDEYDACFRAGGCSHFAWSASGNRGAYPATDVSREDANQYTHWLSCTAGGKYRLPSDAEWMTAAQPEARRFRHVEGATPALANCRGCGGISNGGTSLPVGSFAPSELGLYDLVGNVWEWMADCAEPSLGGPRCLQGKVRGGGFSTRRSVAVTLPEGRLGINTRDRNIGFRVARELEGASPTSSTLCETTSASRRQLDAVEDVESTSISTRN